MSHGAAELVLNQSLYHCLKFLLRICEADIVVYQGVMETIYLLLMNEDGI